MALPASGQITLKQINAEFGGSNTLKSNATIAGISTSNVGCKSFYGLQSGPVYVGNHRVADNGFTDTITPPASLEVGGIIVAVTGQRREGTAAAIITSGATILNRVEQSGKRTVQIASYTGGNIVVTYGHESDTQVCLWYFNNAALGGETYILNNKDGPALACQADVYVLNLWAWNGTANIDAINTTDWGLRLPGSLTSTNCAGMCKFSAVAATHDPGSWNSANGTGINYTLEIRGK